jgi:dolichol-phosphate mannosyltransferase
MMNELVVLLPAYNEELNVKQMVDTWRLQEKLLHQKYNLVLKIVVVNDGSKDKTEEICQSISKLYHNFTYISHPQNSGLGEAMKTAILYIINNCPDCKYACVMDCDNTQDPIYISSMLDKIGARKATPDADVVIASRYRKGSKVYGVARYRLLTSEGAKYVYSMILRVKNVRDYTCGYRLYTPDILKKCYKHFENAMIEEAGFSCMAELLYKLYIVGARFGEVPFVLRYDFKQGKSKMKVLKTAIASIKLAFRLRRLNMPNN